MRFISGSQAGFGRAIICATDIYEDGEGLDQFSADQRSATLDIRNATTGWAQPLSRQIAKFRAVAKLTHIARGTRQKAAGRSNR